MKVIELLNKIANGEEVPEKIKYINSIWKYDKETKDYFHDDLWLIYTMNSIGLTEREVEMIEEDKKEDNKIEKLEEDNKQLKELCDKYEEEHSTTFEEWKKDINIINELEKWLIDNIEYGDDDYYDMKAMGVESALNKLKELKGDNK